MKNIRILIVDDQTIVRVGIRQLVAKISRVEIVGEARDGREALELIQTRQPDVVLMDLEMSGLNGLDTTVRVVKEFPEVKVIILSAHATEHHVMLAIRAGAKGYIPKSSDLTELDLAIRFVSKDQTYLSPEVYKNFLNLVRSAGKSNFSPDHLSSRQCEILQLITEGKTIKEIAFLLNLSPKTVEAHRTHLAAKLGIQHVPDLVHYAIREQLVSPPTLLETDFAVSGIS